MTHPCSQRRTRPRTLRRILQAISFIAFILLTLSATWPIEDGLVYPISVSFFMALDPLWALLLPIMAQTWIPMLGFGLAILLLTVLFGRFFCGAICPLGTLLDILHPLSSLATRYSKPIHARQLPHNIRFIIFFFCLGAAIVGSNLAFLFDPLAILTRAVAIPVHAGLSFLGDSGLTFLQNQPIFTMILQDWGLEYSAIAPKPQTSPLIWASFLLGLPVLILSLEWYSPRFWCRVLCPTGALLSLMAWRPYWHRHVDKCSHCGQCQQICPTQAIRPNQETNSTRCLVCQRCVAICPTQGIRFTHSTIPHTQPNLSRRIFLGTASTGLITGAVTHFATNTFAIAPKVFLRPPASLPEQDFIERCIRCGLCIKACPTGALQLANLDGGLSNFMTPIIVARLGMCEPLCHACADVCSTKAIANISQKERPWARIGTAHIDIQRCIAWSTQQRCMVCQEVCPYGAVFPQRNAAYSDSDIPVPYIETQRCAGCGYCEYHCPAVKHAISIKPDGALRLSGESYTSVAQAQGLYLVPYEKTSNIITNLPVDELPPGFTK